MCSLKISTCLCTLRYQYYSSNAEIWEVGVWAGACNEGLDSGLAVWVGIGWLGGIGLEARVSDDTSLCGSNVTYALGHSVLLQDSGALGVNLFASSSCDEEPTEICFLLFPKKIRTTKKYSWHIPRPISRSLGKLFPELFPETVFFRPLPCKIKKNAKKNNSRNASRISHVIPAGFRT